MSHEITVIEDQVLKIDGTSHKVKSCCFCGSKTVYIQYRGGKYQVKCWWDTSCKNRSGWHDTLIDALEVWNERVGVF